MPVTDTVVLEQRSTYILPTKAGIFLFGVILLMMIGATNYQNNLAYMLTFLTASVGLVSILYTFKNLQGLVFKKGPVESVCAEEMLVLPVYIESQYKQNHLTIGVGFEKNSLQMFDVDGDQETKVDIYLPAKQRGWLQIPRIKASSTFPFGLLNAWAWFKFSSRVLIYPKPLEPPSLSGDNQNAEDDEGRSKAGTEDLYGLKTYQSGEPISRIDWKAWARERGLFSKEFVEYQTIELSFRWQDFSTYEDEKILSYLCYLVLGASKSNFEFSLTLPDEIVSKSAGDVHLKKCLRALAQYGQRDN